MMTDAQILAVSITVVAVLLGTLFSNSRITDLNSRIVENNMAINRRMDESAATLNKRMEESTTALNRRMDESTTALNRRMDDLKDVLRAESRAMEARMELRFNSIDRKLDELLRIVGDHEIRISKLEDGQPVARRG